MTSAPSTNARLRPCDETSRRTITSRAVRLLEDGLDGGGLLAGPHELGAGAAADEQADRADEDRFAGAGFAGEDVEAGRELELETIDDGQMADAEEPDHGTAEVPSYQTFDSA